MVMNLGLIVTIIGSAGRAVWWVSKLDSRVDKNSKDITAAHVKLRDIEREKSRYIGEA